MDSLLSKVLIVFRVLGVYQPVTLPKFNPAIFVLALLVTELTIATLYPRAFFEYQTNVRYLLNWMQGYPPLFVYILVVLEAVKSRKMVHKIFRDVHAILDIFEDDLKSPIKIEFRQMIRSFIVYALAVHLFCSTVEIRILYGVQQQTVWFNNRLMYFPGHFGNRTFLLLFILHVRIFRFLLKSILEYQKEINFKIQYCNPKRHAKLIDKQEEMQLHLRRAFNKLVRINWLINDAFKFSILSCFLLNFVLIAVSWVWNYISYRFGNPFLLGECSLIYRTNKQLRSSP